MPASVAETDFGTSGKRPLPALRLQVGADVLRACASLLPLLLLTVSVQIGILSDAVVAVFLLLILLPLCFLLYLVWVPLCPNEVTDRRLVEAARKRIAEQKQGRGGEK